MEFKPLIALPMLPSAGRYVHSSPMHKQLNKRQYYTSFATVKTIGEANLCHLMDRYSNGWLFIYKYIAVHVLSIMKSLIGDTLRTIHVLYENTLILSKIKPFGEIAHIEASDLTDH